MGVSTVRPAAVRLRPPVAAVQWTATSSLGRPVHSGPHRGVRPDARPRRPRRRSARAPTSGRPPGASVEACGRWLCRAGDRRSPTRPGRGRSPCFVAGFGDEFGAGHVELNGFGVSPQRVQPLVRISLDVVCRPGWERLRDRVRSRRPDEAWVHGIWTMRHHPCANACRVTPALDASARSGRPRGELVIRLVIHRA